MLRPADPSDCPQIIAVTKAGFETYRSFAPDGWEPPADMTDDSLAARLAGDHAYGVVAVENGDIVGFGAFEHARDPHPDGELVDGLAHVWAVFVAPSHWGTGTAAAVLGALHDEIRARGYTEARLFSAAGQARARRFYAREGWQERGAPIPVPALGLDVVEMRYSPV